MAPASAVPTKVGAVSLVMLSPRVPESLTAASATVGDAGAVASTLKTTPLAVLELPALSVTLIEGV